VDGTQLLDQAGKVVPFSVEVERVAEARPELAYLRVIPVNEMSEGRYRLEVTRLPDGAHVPPYVWRSPDTDAELSSAFWVGSHPALLAIRWCRTEERESVLLELSEPVDVESLGRVAVSGCSLLSPDSRSFEAPETQLSFRCDGDDLRSTRTVEALGLMAVSGRSVEVTSDAIEVDWNTMTDWGAACRVFRP
jgi:hypothetical protein